jgi:succinoglycan biosynthesis transport protein ExoP
MRQLVAYWRTKFDHNVIDTPPLLGLSDAVVVAALADAVIMVVRSSLTGRQALARSRESLMRTNSRVVGLVLNDLNPNSSDHYGYYGYYGSAYRNYYGQPKAEEN